MLEKFVTILVIFFSIWACKLAAKSQKETRKENGAISWFAYILYGLVALFLSLSTGWIPRTIYLIILIGITALAALNQEGKARFWSNNCLVLAIWFCLLMSNATAMEHGHKSWHGLVLILAILAPIVVGWFRLLALEGVLKLPKKGNVTREDFASLAMRLSVIAVLTIAIIVVVLI